MPTMRFRLALLSVFAVVVSACTTTSAPTNPLQERWNGKSAGEFFAAFGPPNSDRSGPGGTTVNTWRGGFTGGRSCYVELIVNKDYTIRTIRALADRPGTNGGPSHCEKTLDAD